TCAGKFVHLVFAQITIALVRATPTEMASVRFHVLCNCSRYMRVAGIIACTLLDVAAGAGEEVRGFCLGFVLQPGVRPLLVHGSFQVFCNALEITPSFFLIAQSVPSIGETCQQLTTLM